MRGRLGQLALQYVRLNAQNTGPVLKHHHNIAPEGLNLKFQCFQNTNWPSRSGENKEDQAEENKLAQSGRSSSHGLSFDDMLPLDK